MTLRSAPNYLCLGFLLVGAGCGAQHDAGAKEIPAPAPSTSAPDVLVKVPSFLVEGSRLLEQKFAVVNETATAIRFRKVETSCGCATAPLGKQELAPGEQTTVVLRINPRGWHGPHRFWCHLIPDDNSPAWSYTIETTVYDPAHFTLPKLILSGVEPRKAVQVDVALQTFARPGADPARIQSIRSTSQDVKVEALAGKVETLSTGPVQRTIPLRVTLAPQSDAGRKEAALLATLAGPGHHVVELPVIWTIQSFYKLVPARADFSDCAKPGEMQASQRFMIRRVDQRPLQLLRVKVSNSVAAAHLETGSPASAMLVLTIERAAVQKRLDGEVVITTGDPDQPELNIPFSAEP
jgi:hypothetical protein